MILIVSSQYDKTGETVRSLEASAIEVLEGQKVDYELVQVPGALEIPVAVQHFVTEDRLAENEITAVITLGCVVRGKTDHYDLVVKSVTEALTGLSLDLQLPVIQGVLACHNEADAIARSGLGSEYAETALYMVDLFKETLINR